ncbi:hypothetical protein [Streptomyces anulatus]|uniref:hypothetical protein n=1 Tax=Streptomyces anulatus TaxID=1892 RepID=UPI0012FEC3E1|nr:hypothetical protein [Streptomyces anulatus]
MGVFDGVRGGGPCARLLRGGELRLQVREGGQISPGEVHADQRQQFDDDEGQRLLRIVRQDPGR